MFRILRSKIIVFSTAYFLFKIIFCKSNCRRDNELKEKDDDEWGQFIDIEQQKFCIFALNNQNHIHNT